MVDNEQFKKSDSLFMESLASHEHKLFISYPEYVHIKLQNLFKTFLCERVSVCACERSLGFCVSQHLYEQTNFLYDSDVFVFMLVCICMVTETKLEE